MQRVPSAGKQAIGTKRGKTCNGYKARENMQRVQSAGKHFTCASRRKMRSSSSHDWLGKINRLARAPYT